MPTIDTPEPAGTPEEEDIVGGSSDYTELLHGFDEEGGLDDSVGTDLESGISVAEIADDPAAGHEEPELLDVGDPLGESLDSDRAADGGDDAGPFLDDDFFATLDDVPPDDDGSEGVREETNDWASGELPPLDANAEPDDAAHPDHSDYPFLPTLELPDLAERPWLPVPLMSPTGPRSVVIQAGARTIAAGDDLVGVGDDGSVESVTAKLESRVAGVVACPGGDAVLLATEAGVLLRAELQGPRTTPVLAWRDASVGTDLPPVLSLGGPTPSARPALLLHVAGADALLESTDGGVTFRRVDLGGPVHVLGTGTPPLCVVDSREGPKLMRSEASGGFTAAGKTWSREQGAAALHSEGRAAVLIDSFQNVHVSDDAGVTFRPAAHCAAATTAIASYWNGRPCAFAALLGPDQIDVTIAWIDASTGDALTIARIPADEEDSMRVESLAWDAETGTLWAAGAFGLRRFRSPPSA